MLDAQVSSNKGRFSVAFDKGCTPMTVNITEMDAFGDATRQYSFFEGAGVTNNKTFTYQEPGVYQIVQTNNVAGIPDKNDTLFIEAFESVRPSVTLTRCEGFDLEISSSDDYYDSVRVYFTPDDSTTLENGESVSFNFTDDSPQSIGLKGFFDGADEICTTFFEDFLPKATLPSPNILSSAIKESCADVYTLYLDLDEIDSLVNYRIYLSQTSRLLLFDEFLTESRIIIGDIPLVEGDFCIDVEVYDACANAIASTTQQCSTTSSLSLSPFQRLYATYDSSGIFINLDQVSSGTFKAYRRLDAGVYEFRSDQAGSFTDPIGSLSRRYSYRVDYLDSCNQILYTAETAPPFVDSKKVEQNIYDVTFTPPVNSLEEIPQFAYQTGNPNTFSSGDITSDFFTVQLRAVDGSPRQFISATATYSDGTVLTSNAEVVRHELIIYVPNVFTPNGDKLNDTLELFGLPTEIATTNIYTRWNQRIYTSDKPSPGWDGTINGSLADEGTYLYEIIFETPDGITRTQRGTFVLIKK